MNKIGIIGLGLIGGSLAKALKNKCNIKTIVALNRSNEPLDLALNEGIIDLATHEIDESFENCDIVFICTPVDKITSYVKKLIPFINKDCIITDVGSTKLSIYEEMKKFKDINFIGGHPMAGSEKTGYSAAKDYLFENAYYALSPTENVSAEKYNLLEALVKNLGAIPVKINPTVHDYAVAAISHLPHIIASALVNCVSYIDTDEKYMHLLAAGGFKDITRIASASPNIWESICIDNKKEIFKVLKSFRKELDTFENNLFENEVFDFFEDAKIYRDSFASKINSNYFNHFEIKVDVVDKIGIIATVATLLSVNNVSIKNIGIINNREFENGVLSIIVDNESDYTKSKVLLSQINLVIY